MSMTIMELYPFIVFLTPILLTWRIWWSPNSARRWEMGFNWAFKGLKYFILKITLCGWNILWK